MLRIMLSIVLTIITANFAYAECTKNGQKLTPTQGSQYSFDLEEGYADVIVDKYDNTIQMTIYSSRDLKTQKQTYINTFGILHVNHQGNTVNCSVDQE